MTQKIFLTSALAMGVIAPAMAETFPTNGLMQENKTYDNAATETNMDGVYEGSVNATAEYDTIDYILTAGKYLPADSETITTCPAGSFCAGGETVQYNQSSAQGIQTCPSGFGSSADGSSSNTQCYRACDINNVGDSITAIAHATAISGNDYYGNGTDTCEPTACEHGWHVKPAVPDLTTVIGTGAGENSSNGSNTWAVDYGDKGFLHGQARCSTVDGTTHTTSELGAEGGEYCYCNLAGYRPAGGTMQSLSSPWVFNGGNGNASNCARYCARGCAESMRGTGSNVLAFRAAMFDSVQSSPAMCEANVININWNDVDPATAGQNNENTAVYGEDVRTPFKAATKKGKTFRGWRFSKPEQTNLPQ